MRHAGAQGQFFLGQKLRSVPKRPVHAVGQLPERRLSSFHDGLHGIRDLQDAPLRLDPRLQSLFRLKRQQLHVVCTSLKPVFFNNSGSDLFLPSLAAQCRVFVDRWPDGRQQQPMPGRKNVQPMVRLGSVS